MGNDSYMHTLTQLYGNTFCIEIVTSNHDSKLWLKVMISM